jgi:hypothetical protein
MASEYVHQHNAWRVYPNVMPQLMAFGDQLDGETISVHLLGKYHNLHNPMKIMTSMDYAGLMEGDLVKHARLTAVRTNPGWKGTTTQSELRIDCEPARFIWKAATPMKVYGVTLTIESTGTPLCFMLAPLEQPWGQDKGSKLTLSMADSGILTYSETVNDPEYEMPLKPQTRPWWAKVVIWLAGKLP